MPTEAATIQLEQVGARLYLMGLSFAMKDKAKSALGMTGTNFDRDRKQWWVGLSKRIDAEKFVADVNGGSVQPEAEDPGKIRLVGKAKYKNRTYYVRSIQGLRARLVTLPDKDNKILDFWVHFAPHGSQEHDGSGNVAVIVKTYEPRESRGQYGRGPARLEYITLSSIAHFIEQQKDPRTRRGTCTECGSYGPAGESCSECGGEGHYA